MLWNQTILSYENARQSFTSLLRTLKSRDGCAVEGSNLTQVLTIFLEIPIEFKCLTCSIKSSSAQVGRVQLGGTLYEVRRLTHDSRYNKDKNLGGAMK